MYKMPTVAALRAATVGIFKNSVGEWGRSQNNENNRNLFREKVFRRNFYCFRCCSRAALIHSIKMKTITARSAMIVFTNLFSIGNVQNAHSGSAPRCHCGHFQKFSWGVGSLSEQ